MKKKWNITKKNPFGLFFKIINQQVCSPLAAPGLKVFVVVDSAAAASVFLLGFFFLFFPGLTPVAKSFYKK